MAAKGYKAFAHGMTCLGKQYSENTVFEESGANACCKEGVMHYCENPLDVLNHYPLIDDNGHVVEIAEVEPLAEVLRDGDKCATKKLKIGAKIRIGNLVEIAGKYLRETIKGKEKDAAVGGNWAKQVGGNSAKQVGGYSAKQVGDDYAKQVGGKFAQQVSDKFAQQVGGDYAQQVSGYFAKQVGGDSAKQVGGNSAQQVGGDGVWQIGGFCSKQVGGNEAIQIGGDCSIQYAGENSIIIAGPGSKFKAGLHSIVLYYWFKNENIAGFKVAQVDNKRLKADTWYRLKGGKFVEVE